MSHKSCEREMTTLTVSAEMSTGLRRLAEPVSAGESIKGLIGRASRRAGLSYSRAYECWYGRARVRADEMDRVRRLLQAKEQEAINVEIAELRQRLARLEEQLAIEVETMGAPAGE